MRAAIGQDPGLLDATNEAGQNAFVLSKYYRQAAVAEYLLSLHPKLDIFGLSIAGKMADTLAEIDRNPALLEEHSSDGWTPLHLAAFFGHAELANALVERGAFVDSRSTNAMKNTPLHAASAGGQLPLVELLLKRVRTLTPRRRAVGQLCMELPRPATRNGRSLACGRRGREFTRRQSANGARYGAHERAPGCGLHTRSLAGGAR